MKKALKIIGKIFLGLLILLAAALLILFIYHQIMLSKEDELLASYPGQRVEVSGHSMNIYVEGEGEHTLVFLAPAGDTSPMLTFKPLYSRLSDGYRTVVIEKFGYGMSDIVDTERDYKVMVDECREALSKAGVDAPYILCPFSKSGLDTLIWTQEYPDEVEAIISIDMAFPADFDNIDLNSMKNSAGLMSFARNTGIIRLFLPDSEFPETYSKEDIAIARALVCRKYGNKVMLNEITTVPDAVNRINSGAKPDVPMLAFLTSGEGTGMDKQTWQDVAYGYTDGMSSVSYTELDCGHNKLMDMYPDQMAEDIRSFTEILEK